MDTVDPIRVLFSFIFILSLIGLLAVGLRRLRAIQAAAAENSGVRVRVLETRYLDPKRKLVLVAKDDMEFLLLLAEGRELVIESRRRDAMMPDLKIAEKNTPT